MTALDIVRTALQERMKVSLASYICIIKIYNNTDTYFKRITIVEITATKYIIL